MEKVIDKKAFQAFMWQLHEVIEQSRELFLPADGICLEPAALFWNLGEQKWEFAYMPGISAFSSSRKESGYILPAHISS